ncbi:MAG: biopolymer transporter ExbD [Planctomycetes bacterium]|nr:biopolymer transporter ExbD [Planctomycetota bacterium]
MRRPKRKTRSGDCDVDVGSFSDIAFLLIIFFILTTTFDRPAGNQLDIPSGTSDPSEKEQKQVTINLKPDEIRLNNGDKGDIPAPISIEELRDSLLALDFPKKRENDRMIILDSAPDVPYEKYYQVVMAISHAGGVLALMEKDDKKK